MSAKTVEERIYTNYHTCLKVAKEQLIREQLNGQRPCCDKHDGELEIIPFENIRALALKMTADRYKVNESEVSNIVRELRPENATKKRPVPVAAKKRIHKRK